MMLQKPSTKALLAALKSSLWNRSIEVEYFVNLSRQDWIEVFNMSFQQTVEGMVCASVQRLPAELLPPRDILLKWLVRLEWIEQGNRRMSHVIAKLYNFYQERGIQCILQKGHGVSQYYDNPLLRSFGDIDWFIPTIKDYARAKTILVKDFQTVHNQNLYNIDYTYQEFVVEHHRKLIQLRNPFVQKWSSKFVKDELKEAQFLELDGVRIQVPSPLLNLVQVNAHILNHEVGYGIGLRQLCDSARLYHCLNDSEDFKKLFFIYKSLGMYSWSHYLHQSLINLLDFPCDKLPYSPPSKVDSSWFQERTLISGNFGFYNPKYPDVNKPRGRVERPERLFNSFKRYVKIAPMEAISFPLYQAYIKIFR